METQTLGLLTVSQAADYLNIPRPTLYQHLREGRIPGIQIGGRWRIETKVLQRFLGLELDSAEGVRGEVPLSGTSSMDDEQAELNKLVMENKRLRAIIAEQLLELHELEAHQAAADRSGRRMQD